MRAELFEPEAEAEPVSDAAAERLLEADMPEAVAAPEVEPLALPVTLRVDEPVDDADGEPVELRREVLDDEEDLVDEEAALAVVCPKI